MYFVKGINLLCSTIQKETIPCSAPFGTSYFLEKGGVCNNIFLSFRLQNTANILFFWQYFKNKRFA